MPGYDPTQSITTWASILIEGHMDGQFFDAEHQEDDVMLHVGGTGLATFVENSNKSGIVTVTLSMRSPSNALLSAAFAARTKGPFLMTDLSDKITKVSGPNARIAKHAPIKRGKEIIGMEWKFLVPRLILLAGGDA